MPKIKFLTGDRAGEIVEVQEGYLAFKSKTRDIDWELIIPEKKQNSGTLIHTTEDSEKGYFDAWDKLSEGQKDSVRKQFKILKKRADGFYLVDNINKAGNSIHQSSLLQVVNIKDAKSSAIQKSKRDSQIISRFKSLLTELVEDDSIFGLGFDNDEIEKDELKDLISKLIVKY
jgi:hypothetical protein